MAHDCFTHAVAGSGIEVHGTKGSVFANGVMSRIHAGTVDLVTAAGSERPVHGEHDLYACSVRPFTGAARGNDSLAACGAERVASVTIAMAVRQAAETGTRVQIMGL